jgi:hypothetical protein
VISNRQGYPVVRWSSCGITAEDAGQALELVMGEPDVPGGTILEVGNESGDFTCSGGAQAGIQILQQNPDHLEVLVEASQPGYLVIADLVSRLASARRLPRFAKGGYVRRFTFLLRTPG